MNNKSFKKKFTKEAGLLFLSLILILLAVQQTGALRYSDCVTCHNETAGSITGKINVSAMNLSSKASHRNLTEGITNDSGSISDEVVKACWACHWNGSDPNTTHTNKTTQAAWRSGHPCACTSERHEQYYSFKQQDQHHNKRSVLVLPQQERWV
jgi:hypothetical protein